ncbi:unnamed protein product [Caenorhabditis nigoni]
MKFPIPLLPALFLTVNGCLRIRVPVKCSPTDPATLLIAYSNDVKNYDPEEFTYDISQWIFMTPGIKYTITATVRFDTKIKEDIVFHEAGNMSDSFYTALNHMNKQQVDPSQRFDSSETGSDVLDMLERFTDTNRPNICGSMVLIAMKRSPNEIEIPKKTLEKLREYRIQLSIGIVIPSPGGLHPETISDLVAQTNGYSVIMNNIRWTSTLLPQIFTPYIHYSLNLKLSGTASINLPPVTLPSLPGIKYRELGLHIGVRSTDTSTSFQNMTLSWTNSHGTTRSLTTTRENMNQGIYDPFDTAHSFNSLLTWYFFNETETSTYEMTLEYSYATEDTFRMRLVSNIPIDHWMPYQDV